MLIDPLNGFYGSVFGLRYYFSYTVRFSNIQINLTTNFATSHHTKKLINPNLQNKVEINRIMGNGTEYLYM